LAAEPSRRRLLGDLPCVPRMKPGIVFGHWALVIGLLMG
jgi:hypothetical protein